MLPKVNIKQIRSKKLKKVNTKKKNNINRKKNTKIKYKKGGSNKKIFIGPNPPPGSEEVGGVTIVPPDPDDLVIYIRSTATLETLKYINHGTPNAVYVDKGIGKIVKFGKFERDNKPELALIDNEMGKEQQIKFTDFISNIDKYPELEPYRGTLINTANKSDVIKDLSTFLKIKGYSFYPTILNKDKGEMCRSQVFEYHHNLKRIAHDLKVIREYKDSFIEVISNFKELNLRGYVHGDMRSCNNIEFVKVESGFKVIDIEAIRPRFEKDIISLYDILNYEENAFIDLFQLIDCLEINKFKIGKKYFKHILDMNLILMSTTVRVVKEMKKEDYYFLEENKGRPNWVKKTLNTSLNNYGDDKYIWGLSKETIIPHINTLTELLYDNLIDILNNHE